MEILFPKKEAWNSNIDGVAFPADVDGQRIGCAISEEALQDNFGGDYAPPLECFKENRRVIEGKAAELIRKRRFESDGSIFIRSSDGA